MSLHRRGAAAVLALAVLSSAGSALAQEWYPRNLTQATAGPTYFNRPGATMAEHDADVLMCASRALGMPQAADNVVMGGLAPMIMAQGVDLTRLNINVEHCMVVKGWRVVVMPRAEGRPLFERSPGAIHRRLSELVGLETPVGEIMRANFANEAANGYTEWGGMPDYNGERILSLRAVDLSTRPTPEPPFLPPHPGRVGPQSEVDMPQITPETVASLPPDVAVAIIHVTGTGRTNGEGFVFARAGAAQEPPIQRSHPTDAVESFYASVRWTLIGGSDEQIRENLLILPLVPGDYRIVNRMNTMDFCLGSPITEVRAGDVVYLGSFDIAGHVLGPDLSLGRAQAALAGDPERLARLRAAEWRNGSVAPCTAVYNYALEIPGAPFEPGYIGGSHLVAEPTSPEIPAVATADETATESAGR